MKDHITAYFISHPKSRIVYEVAGTLFHVKAVADGYAAKKKVQSEHTQTIRIY